MWDFRKRETSLAGETIVWRTGTNTTISITPYHTNLPRRSIFVAIIECICIFFRMFQAWWPTTRPDGKMHRQQINHNFIIIQYTFGYRSRAIWNLDHSQPKPFLVFQKFPYNWIDFNNCTLIHNHLCCILHVHTIPSYKFALHRTHIWWLSPVWAVSAGEGLLAQYKKCSILIRKPCRGNMDSTIGKTIGTALTGPTLWFGFTICAI